MTHANRVALVAVAVAIAACRGGSGPGPGPSPDPGVPVSVALTADQQAQVDAYRGLVAANDGLDADALLARRAIAWRTALGYDPLAAVNLDLVQGSALGLDTAELAALGADGFVVTDRRRYPHFAYGYQEIYSHDLPVFVSADSILQAVHQSYDGILEAIEYAALAPELDALLVSMRARLAADAALGEGARTDADLFLAVGLSLLRGTTQPPVATASATDVASLAATATSASGWSDLVLFGTSRTVDWSQFLPRGHYTHTEALRRYFRAMIWLGRIDLPFLQTDPGTGTQVFRRRSVEAAFALRHLMDADAFARWSRVDATIRAFVGEPDSMGPPDVDRLEADLGIAGGDLSSVPDETLAAAIVAGAYGTQRILSQIVIQALHEGPWPLDATFLFMGQRYVFDSHVLSNVVYDRAPRRMMPNPLDVAYAALANDQAASLLAPELAASGYAPQLESIRALGDAHGQAFWDANLYNRWLSALRALSPGPDVTAAVPAVAGTERWGRRLLQTQLASWAELRHDTILYAKPSYTTGMGCDFPDAYVEPNPEFFARLEAFADAGAVVVAALPLDPSSTLSTQILSWFERLRSVSGTLRAMAEQQRIGTPHTAEQLAFVNRAVSVGLGCGGPVPISGWYADLFFDPGSAARFDPTIADVHTQPTDTGGNMVGWVLHAGTGYARFMVMTAETCAGPRAYAGVVSSYHELVTENFTRLTDEDWSSRLRTGQAPPTVPWLADVVVPSP